MRMVQGRGFHLSKSIQRYEHLKTEVLGQLESEKEVFNLDPMLLDTDSIEAPSPAPVDLSVSLDVPHFLSVPVNPLWSAYAAADQLCNVSDRSGLVWFARLGDFVAVSTSDDLFLPQGSLPFSVAWKVGQVLSIYQPCDGDIMIEIRWLEKQQPTDGRDLAEVLEPSATVLGDVPVKDLLGPVTIFGDKLSRSQWETVYPFLPVVPVIFGDKRKDVGIATASQARPLHSISSYLSQGLAMSAHYNENDLPTIFHQIDSLKHNGGKTLGSPVPQTLFGSPQRNVAAVAESREESPVSQLFSAAHVTGSAFHVDKSCQIQFFKTLDVVVPSEALPFHELQESDTSWTVKVGDVVVLQYDVGARRVGVAQCEPFSMPWGVGEIVTIFTVKRPTAGPDSDEVALEIRWFYRLEDIPGSERQKVEACDSILDELLESDHYDEVSPSCLLAPAHLIDPNDDNEVSSSGSGSMFVFLCRSFWSHKNKSIVPTGGLSGRVERGQRFSRFFSQLHTRASSAQGTTAASSSAIPTEDPQFVVKSFQRVIEKLSLTDASKEAVEDNTGLVGRQKERKTIGDFLRQAIVGRINDKRPSIFIAGPPGVGKTACVRAVVNDLQREQAAGDLPSFRFISMNGMEMRHPLEFYARFLELLIGDRVGVAAKAASQRLDNYFGKPEGERSTIVLLVDEIDYLVTKDQNVIYSLFDWPARAAENSCPKRLVLIGISNTLNLPEQMHPRVQSRLGSHRCPFRAYGILEAAEILRTKITHASPHYQVFKADCIDFAAKKTATMSGDIRKALTICRTAAESVLDEIESGKNVDEKPQVVLKHLFNVTASAFNSPQAHRIACLAEFEVLLIVALAVLSKSTGREQGGFDIEEVMTKMQAMTNALGDSRYGPPLTIPECLVVLGQLASAHLVSLYTQRNTSICYRAALTGSGGAWPLVSPLMDENTLWMAFKNGQHEALAKKYLRK